MRLAPTDPCRADTRDYQLPCTADKTFVPYVRVPGDVCKMTDAATRLFAAASVVPDCYAPASGGASTIKKLAKGVAVMVGLFVAGVVGISAAFFVSKDARSFAIRVLGTETGLAGRVGGLLSRFSCFRRRETYVYSVLAEDAAGPAKLESLDDGDDDDDELLFGLDDSNLRGAQPRGFDHHSNPL